MRNNALNRNQARPAHAWVACAALMLAACSQDDPQAKGAESLKNGDYKAAVIHLRTAVQEQPKSAAARLALADALERVNDAAGVESNLRKALESGGNEAVLAPRIAFLMLEANDLQKLISEFAFRRLDDPAADSDLRAVISMAFSAQGNPTEAASRLDGTQATPTVHLARSQMLLAQGKRKEALAELSDSAKAASAPWWVLRAASRLANLNGQPDLGLSAIKRAQEAAPWSNALMGEYAEGLLNADQFDQAKALQAKLRKGAPGYFWTDYINARFLARDGRIDDALAAALRVLQASQDHLPATLIAAAAELQRAQPQSAYKRLQNITAKYPRSLDALALLAEAQQQVGLPKEATNTVRKGLLMAPSSAKLLSLKADIELRQGQPAAAAATLAQLVQREPQDASARLRLAEVKAGLRDKAAAAQLLDQAADLAKGDAALFDRIVATALRLKDVPSARRLVDRALQELPSEPQIRLSLAAVQAAENDTEGARKSVLAALDLKPAYQPALAALGNMTRKPAQRAELLSRYDAAVKAGAAEPGTYLQYAEWLRQPGVEAKVTALSVLEQGVSARPDALALRTALVEAYLRAGTQDKAVSTAQSAAAVLGAGDEAQLLLAGTYQRVGQIEESAALYRKLAAANPQRPDWRLKVAQLEVDAGRPNEAIGVLRSLVASQPDYAEAYIRLGRLLVVNEPSGAVAVARQLAQRQGLNLPGLLLEADLLALTKKPDEALAQYAKAADAGALPDALLGRVAVMDSQGQRGAADTELEGVLRRFPKNPNVLSFASQRAIKAGQPAKGIEWLAKIVELDPGNPIALNDLAWAQAQAGLPQALANAKKASELMPNHPVVLDTLGVALQVAGRADDAVQVLQSAVNVAPTMGATRLHLAQALLAAGKKPEAEKMAKSIASERLNAGDRAALERLSASLKA